MYKQSYQGCCTCNMFEIIVKCALSVPVTLVTSTTTTTTSAPMIASDTTSSSTAIQLASKPGAGGGGGGVDGLQGCQIDGQFYMDGMQVKYKDTTITKLKYLFTVKAGFQV